MSNTTNKLVRVETLHSKAACMFIAGSFSGWNPVSIPLHAIDFGHWAVELDLPPGHYEYRFIADGEWISDPASHDYTPNPFGSFNSVLIVT